MACSISFHSSALFASFHYGLGSYTSYFQKAKNNSSGKLENFELNPYVHVGSQLAFHSKLYFVPEVGFAYFLDTPSHVKKNIIFLHYNFSYFLRSRFIFRYGLSNHLLQLEVQASWLD